MSLRKVPFGFAPTSITGCQLWLDGADPTGNRVIPTNGATVSTWNDKSGNGYTAAATGSPTYVAGGGVNFNSSSYFLNQTFSQNLSQRSIFIVFQETTNTQYAGVFSIIPTPNSGNDQSTTNGLSSEITNNTLFFVGNSSGYQSQIGSGNPLPKAIYHDSMNGTIGSGYFNGTNATNVTASYTAGTCSGYGLGGRWQGGSMSGSYRLNGVIYEILFFNSVLGTTQRQQVESYLAQKWGTTASLPGGHPGLTTTVFKADYIKNSAIIRNVAKPIPYFAAFSPRQIPGCSLWMDGADSSTMTTASGYISAWTSKGTNALSFTQPTSTKQPLLVANVYNGYSVVRCINPGDPVVNVNITTVNNAVLQTGASFCIFIVHNPTIANGSPFCFQNGGGNRIACHLTENGNVVFDTPNVRLTYAAPGNYLTSGLKLDVFWSVANAINYRASGTATASASAGPSSWTDGTLTFGSFTPTQGSYYYQTDIAEIIWFNTALALPQVQQVESYLSQKWGLTTSLPGGHSHLTQRAGAITTVANTKFSMVGVPRIIFTATGGTIVTSGFKYHLFTSSSNFVVSMDSKTVNYLVVGGGGGGGDRHGGGGGGGGVLTGTWTASVGTYTVTVGLGGVAGYYETNNSTPRGAGIKGGDSSLSGTGVSVTANGGGGGGTYDGNPTGTVGSGGGGGGNNLGGVAGTAGQGNSGGSGAGPGGGGGGGAGGVGANANTSTGGIGTTSYSTQLLAVGYGTSFAVPTSPNVVISGGVAYIAAGGGGAASGGPGPGGSGGLGGGGRGDWNASFIQAGTANTGGGGGGSRSESEPSFGRDGGSGLVLLWYSV